MSLVWVIHQTSLASVKVAQRFADAGAEAPLLQLPFVPQGVVAKVSDTTMLPKEQKVCPTKKPC
jgi:hypothetical protein